MGRHRKKREKQRSYQLLAYSSAARFLGLPVGTLYSLVHRRQIPHIRLSYRLVRFDLEELAAWVENHRRPPQEHGRDGEKP